MITGELKLCGNAAPRSSPTPYLTPTCSITTNKVCGAHTVSQDTEKHCHTLLLVGSHAARLVYAADSQWGARIPLQEARESFHDSVSVQQLTLNR